MIFSELGQEEKKELAEHYRQRGARKVLLLGNIRLYECPLTWIEAQSFDVISAVTVTLDTGALLFPGSLAQQPNWYIEALNLYRSEAAQCRSET